MLQIDSDPRPCLKAAAHGVDEDIGWLQMRHCLGMPALPSFESCQGIRFLACPSDFDQRMFRSATP
jgi:hypothetical protein